MSFASLSLGEKIVLVARLAAEAHLTRLRAEENQVGRRRTTGGAGLSRVTDDLALPEPARAFIGATLAEGEAL
jgi:hypothetical protein